MLDIRDVKSVEILVDQFGKIWVNVDGACKLRIGRAEIVTIDDPVRGFDVVIQKPEE